MKKLRVYQKKPVPLHSLLRHKCRNRSNRDVAQLVAHYVRDVGVASSNLVIPTIKKALISRAFLICLNRNSKFLKLILKTFEKICKKVSVMRFCNLGMFIVLSVQKGLYYAIY